MKKATQRHLFEYALFMSAAVGFLATATAMAQEPEGKRLLPKPTDDFVKSRGFKSRKPPAVQWNGSMVTQGEVAGKKAFRMVGVGGNALVDVIHDTLAVSVGSAKTWDEAQKACADFSSSTGKKWSLASGGDLLTLLAKKDADSPPGTGARAIDTLDIDVDGSGGASIVLAWTSFVDDQVKAEDSLYAELVKRDREAFAGTDRIALLGAAFKMEGGSFAGSSPLPTIMSLKEFQSAKGGILAFAGAAMQQPDEQETLRAEDVTKATQLLNSPRGREMYKLIPEADRRSVAAADARLASLQKSIAGGFSWKHFWKRHPGGLPVYCFAHNDEERRIPEKPDPSEQTQNESQQKNLPQDGSTAPPAQSAPGTTTQPR